MTRADSIADEFEGSTRAGSGRGESASGPNGSAPETAVTRNGNSAAPETNGGAPRNGHNGHHPHIPRLHINGHSAADESDEPPEPAEDARATTDAPAPGAARGESPGDTASDPAEPAGAEPGRAGGRTPRTPAPATAPASADTAPVEPRPAGEDPREKPVRVEHHESLPDMARHAAGAWLRAAGWTAGTSLRVGTQLAKIASDPNNAQDVLDDVTREVRGVAREFLGINELDEQVQQIAPLVGSGLLRRGGSSPDALRAQGEELLRNAADVGFDEGAHPAFARILNELSPDEARILRMLALEGAQPMVDVRATNLIGNGSQLIAQSLNMLGVQSGVRHRDRVPVYLSNLVRLNLIVLSEDALGDVSAYQVLEAQPEVLSTLKETPRAKPIRRSVTMTPLGQEFCEVCLPLQLPALPPPDHSG